MKILNIYNPFHAPVFFVEQCDSTQTLARSLLAEKPASGTVVTSAFQSKGRGRGTNRQWKAAPGENLLFTVALRYENIAAIPPAFTLRLGLAVAEAISQFAPALEKLVAVKWPNDVMIGSRKVSGILAENDGSYVLSGIGINLNQLNFPEELSKKAVSIRQALSEQICGEVSFMESRNLLEKILPSLQHVLSSAMNDKWNDLLQKRLYKKGEPVSFIPGQADSTEKVEGVLQGIGANGELLIKIGTETKSFITGELSY
jgi:BirA family biotin operon repressor/biotin-[acetyl-CoA-carboxylase] ligase